MILILILLCVSLVIQLEHSSPVHVIRIWTVLYHISVSSKFSSSSSRYLFFIFYFFQMSGMQGLDLFSFPLSLATANGSFLSGVQCVKSAHNYVPMNLQKSLLIWLEYLTVIPSCVFAF